MTKIKIGQIGTGHGHASGKMETFKGSPDFEVVGIAEPDGALRPKAERQSAYRDIPWMSVEQLLNTPGLQAVAIETEPKDLLNYAEKCVTAGMHIHLDKPAGESLSQFRRILNSAASKHLCVQMGYMFRYNPGVVILKDMLKKGFLGDPFEMHCVISKVVDDFNRGKHGEYAGGMMFELGCHMIDIVVDLLGQPSSVASFAQHVSPKSDPLLDNMLAVFTYPKAIASVKSSGVEVDGFARRHLVLCGTEGTAMIEPMDSPKQLRLTLTKERGKYKRGRQEVELEPFKRYVADVADLAKIIRNEKAADWSIMHDLAVQETVLRASGRPID